MCASVWRKGTSGGRQKLPRSDGAAAWTRCPGAAGREVGRHATLWLVTYLLHLVQRGLLDTKLLKVICRGADHLVDDLLVDGTLAVVVSTLRLSPPLAYVDGFY